MSKSMYRLFALTNQEFAELQKRFGDLVRYEGWQLLRKNAHNNHTEELEDIEQDILISVVKAGVYYKRQTYIEESLRLARKYARDRFVRKLVKELEGLWVQRTKHGANRQRFGEAQERILESIVQQCVPASKRPDRNKGLVIDGKFARYCKQITWNQQKSLGRKITRERSVRTGLTSLSDYSYLAEI